MAVKNTQASFVRERHALRCREELVPLMPPIPGPLGEPLPDDFHRQYQKKASKKKRRSSTDIASEEGSRAVADEVEDLVFSDDE